MAYPHLNVKVVGSHGGLSVGEDLPPISAARTSPPCAPFPACWCAAPCDGHEMKLAVKALLDHEGPAYLRLGRLAVETVTDTIPGYTFEAGQGTTLKGRQRCDHRGHRHDGADGP